MKRRGRRLPERIGASDLLLLGVATYKLSRLISKDSVTSVIRASFAEFQGPAGLNEVNEQPRGSGVQHALGELLTCPFCLVETGERREERGDGNTNTTTVKRNA